MFESSLKTSVVAARIAATELSPNGLLLVPGSAACAGPTPWAISYGAVKAGVHHLVKSLAAQGSGLPEGAKVVGIAPVMLDTPANRNSMPEADYSTWTPLEEVAEKVFRWASAAEPVASGAVYRISTGSDRTTSFHII